MSKKGKNGFRRYVLWCVWLPRSSRPIKFRLQSLDDIKWALYFENLDDLFLIPFVILTYLMTVFNTESLTVGEC